MFKLISVRCSVRASVWWVWVGVGGGVGGVGVGVSVLVCRCLGGRGGHRQVSKLHGQFRSVPAVGPILLGG